MPARSTVRPRSGVRIVTLTDQLQPSDVGSNRELSFDVPHGVARIEVEVEPGTSSVAMAVFDELGPGWSSPGFRGMYGPDRARAHMSLRHASRAFRPGAIGRGTWTVVLPVIAVVRPTPVTVTVTMTGVHTGGDTGGVPRLPRRVPPPRGVVRAVAGWYRGDLHCHTQSSSDAWTMGSSLSVRDWGAECARRGLDFAAMTDHNVVSQNHDVRAASRQGVLLLAGEEMTSWSHGHCTIAGLPVDAWLDWRQGPAGRPLGDHERRITQFVATARDLGTYTAAAHPMRRSAPWEFLADARADDADRGVLPDGIEVWNGSTFSESTIGAWESFLARGWRVTASGGSDFHGWNRVGGPGQPTTIVYADRLARDDLIAALRAGRCSVTRAPDGGELYLSARGPGDQRAIVGGTVHGRDGDTATIEVVARRGAVPEDVGPLTVRLLRDGAELSRTLMAGASERLEVEVPIAGAGYVRAELRRPTSGGGLEPRGSDLEALTNPIWLSIEPGEPEPMVAPPPEIEP